MMEKKVWLLCAGLIVLGFYSVTMLFVMGNPWSTTNAAVEADAHVDNITLVVPLSLLSSIGHSLDQNFSTPPTNGLPTWLGGLGSNPLANAFSDNQNVYIHLGNISISAKGSEQNIDVAIQRLLIPIVLYGLSQQNGDGFDYGMVPQVTDYSGFLLGILAGVICVVVIAGILKIRSQPRAGR